MRLPACVLPLVAGVALAAPASAAAGTPPKPPASNAAVQAYIEQIPTSSGSVAAGASNNSSRGLTRALKKRLHAQAPAEASGLESAATSSGYGAPQKSGKPIGDPRPKARPIRTPPGGAAVAARSGAGSLRAAESGGPGWRIVGLGVGLLLITLGVLALRLGRLRRVLRIS